MKSSGLRRRLRAINELGHLAYVDIPRVCAHMRALGLQEGEAVPMMLLEL